MQKLKSSLIKDIRKNEILIDTNVLVYMYENKKDIFEFAKNKISNAHFIVLDKTINELEKIYCDKVQKLKHIKQYLSKLEEINKFEIMNVSASLNSQYRNVDSLLVYFCKKYIIFTNDKKLKLRIKRKNGRILSLGSKDVFIN